MIDNNIIDLTNSFLNAKKESFLSEMKNVFNDTNPIKLAYIVSKIQAGSVFNYISEQPKDLLTFTVIISKPDVGYTLRITFYLLKGKLDGYIASIDDGEEFIDIYTSSLGFSKNEDYDLILEAAMAELK